jgi:hypothetical protein
MQVFFISKETIPSNHKFLKKWNLQVLFIERQTNAARPCWVLFNHTSFLLNSSVIFTIIFSISEKTLHLGIVTLSFINIIFNSTINDVCI